MKIQWKKWWLQSHMGTQRVLCWLVNGQQPTIDWNITRHDDELYFPRSAHFSCFQFPHVHNHIAIFAHSFSVQCAYEHLIALCVCSVFVRIPLWNTEYVICEPQLFIIIKKWCALCDRAQYLILNITRVHFYWSSQYTIKLWSFMFRIWSFERRTLYSVFVYKQFLVEYPHIHFGCVAILWETHSINECKYAQFIMNCPIMFFVSSHLSISH